MITPFATRQALQDMADVVSNDLGCRVTVETVGAERLKFFRVLVAGKHVPPALSDRVQGGVTDPTNAMGALQARLYLEGLHAAAVHASNRVQEAQRAMTRVAGVVRAAEEVTARVFLPLFEPGSQADAALDTLGQALKAMNEP